MLQLTKRLYFRACGASQVFHIHRRPKSNTAVSSSSIVSTCASPPSTLLRKKTFTAGARLETGGGQLEIVSFFPGRW